MVITQHMIDTGAAMLYSGTREDAVAKHDEARFEACCQQAEQLFNAMLEARSEVSQDELARGEPVNTYPHLW